MNCNSKTMLKVVVALGLAFAVAYFALPAAHAFLLANAPLLAVLVCPVMMLFMMMGMNGNKKDENAKPGESKAAPPVDHAADPDKA